MFVIAGSVPPGNRIKGFFKDGYPSPARLLDTPERFRYAGFDVATNDVARMMGEYWEVSHGDRKVIRLYHDGTLVFRMRADADFLGWGSQTQYFPGWVNPVAAVESQTSFVHLFSRIVPLLDQPPNRTFFSLKFENAYVGDRRLTITEYRRNPANFAVEPDLFPIHDFNAQAMLDLPGETLVNRPNRCAFEVVRAFYALFDAPETLIPFTKLVDGQREIDLDAIKNPKG